MPSNIPVLKSIPACVEVLKWDGLDISVEWLRRECEQGRIPYLDSEPEWTVDLQVVRERLASRCAFLPPRKADK
jgi:hypothetical protein